MDYNLTKNNDEIYDDENVGFVADLTSRKLQYCSVNAVTVEEKKALFNSTNSPQFRTSECINEIIYVKNVFVESVNCVNQQTGEVTECPRVILIDSDGAGYQSVSLGIFSALKKLFGMFGEPNEWSEPIPIKIKQVTKGEKKILTFEIA